MHVAMRKFFLLICLLGIYALSYAYNNTYAVIVAVADYKFNGDLSYTLNDAKQFYNFLRSRKGGSVPSSNIVYLTESSASKSNIITQARSLFSRAKKNDRVIFYFSGHGSSGCFVPYDADLYGNNLLYFSEVKSIFRCSESNTKLLFADACQSGSMKGLKTKKAQQRMKSEKKGVSQTNIAVMVACRGTEISSELSDLRQGIFTYYLIQGLGGAANADKNKYVTIKELYYYVYKKTRAKAASCGRKQTPELFGNFDLRLIVAKK